MVCWLGVGGVVVVDQFLEFFDLFVHGDLEVADGVEYQSRDGVRFEPGRPARARLVRSLVLVCPGCGFLVSAMPRDRRHPAVRGGGAAERAEVSA